MKKRLPVLALGFAGLVLAASLVAQPAQVEQWDCLELSFSAPATANPFIGVNFTAVFEKDGQRFEPEGFYDGSSEEMVYRFWVGMIGGTYVTHGETRRGEIGEGWISRGGVLTRESPARIAFLKGIVEQSGLEELDPIDQGFKTNIAGKAGKYYLIYFGKEQPQSWPFVLPRAGLEPGMRFKVDIIDTWEMKIQPLDRTFEVERAGRYEFGDKNKQVISLPGKPYMALRIRCVKD